MKKGRAAQGLRGLFYRNPVPLSGPIPGGLG